MYNLTSKQKEILQWIVQNVREGNLEEEFTFVYVASGDIHFIGRGAKGVSNPPFISEGVLNALMASELILFSESDKHFIHLTLLGKAYEAVDSNFAKIEEKPNNSPKNSVFGTPNPKYSFDVFVLMPFASELKPIYDNHIRKTVKALNLSIVRADDFFSQESIMDEIWSAIACATILIADCTNKNPNVFYEIGLAHAIGKPVILITQNPDDVPFDLRHRRYIQYAYTPPGMEKFEKDLSATIAEIQKDLESSEK
jgi:hypothetical protein